MSYLVKIGGYLQCFPCDLCSHAQQSKLRMIVMYILTRRHRDTLGRHHDDLICSDLIDSLTVHVNLRMICNFLLLLDFSERNSFSSSPNKHPYACPISVVFLFLICIFLEFVLKQCVCVCVYVSLSLFLTPFLLSPALFITPFYLSFSLSPSLSLSLSLPLSLSLSLSLSFSLSLFVTLFSSLRYLRCLPCKVMGKRLIFGL